MSLLHVDPGYAAKVADEAVARHGTEPSGTIPILQEIQDRLRWLPEPALRRVAESTDASLADLYGLATFYSQFRLRPVGRNIVSVCHGTACHVKGSELIEDALRRHLQLANGADTDRNGEFTIERVACLGCCTLAPVVRIEGVTYGQLKPDTAPKALEDYLRRPRHGAPVGAPQASRNATELRIAIDSCCAAGGADAVHAALLQAQRRLGAAVSVCTVSCTGLCHQIPLVEAVEPSGERRIYAHVAPEEAEAIVLRHDRPPSILSKALRGIRLCLDRVVEPEEPPPWKRFERDPQEPSICRFVGPQLRIATEGSGSGDPASIEDYEQSGGFEALRKASRMDPEEIIRAVELSGLRGRGGAGFPTGRKWRTVRQAPGERRYLIINGDEGDPGAFMDRMLLESFPFRVLEGAAIAALAIGAEEGVLYVRAEYPHAVERASQAIRAMEARGLLGEDFAGSGRKFHLRLVRGAGAFVCGEETALIAALEGRRGTPTLRPPYPAERGLWGQPTCVNNVETYSLVPWILKHGPEAFAAIGTERSKGTKVFALAGKVRRGGLIEVPMGTTIRQIVEEIGGGVPEGRRFKAVQIGGPSGGCVPAGLADTPVDYEELQKVGAIMGSGGMVVLDDTDCMVDVARFFLRFTQRESCGQCTSCRIGTLRMLEVLDRLCTGTARPTDLDTLEQLASHVAAGSLCGLGTTAPNPVVTSLRYFRDEYEAHLRGECPARRCPELIRYHIDRTCVGCTLCAQACPTGAIQAAPHQRHTVQDDLCVRCDACRTVCPEHAVVRLSPRRGP
ncbi:MAG TPA: proton-conducting membrane transporter [Armatimonadetes bacterium]|nr:proton-conducting membrane transporter [Armatimonadota bacterium]